MLPFAQGEPMPTTLMGAIILVLVSAVGSLIWLVKHLVSETIPKLIETHANSLVAAIKDFKEEMKVERASHLTAVASLQAQGAADAKEHRHKLDDVRHSVVANGALLRMIAKLPPDAVPLPMPEKRDEGEHHA